MNDDKMQELDLDNLEEVTLEEIEPLEVEVTDEAVEEEIPKKADKTVESDEDEVLQKEESKKTSRAEKRIRELVAQRKAAETERTNAYEENKRLREELNTFKKTTVSSQKELIKDSVVAAKKQLKIALDSDDNDAIVEAQAALNTAQSRLSVIESIREEDFVEDEKPVQTTQKANASDGPAAMQDWLEDNQWFQNPTNQREGAKIQTAVGIYNLLVSEGEDPNSEEFYEALDQRLGVLVGKKQKVDKNIENDVQSSSDDESSSDAQTVKREKKKISQTVQGASRTPNQTSQTQKNKVTLSTDQQRIADSLGISHKEYARQLLRVEAASKRGEKMVELF
jgi:hypothetical protein